jgi:hydroxypyruvate isomerase
MDERIQANPAGMNRRHLLKCAVGVAAMAAINSAARAGDAGTPEPSGEPPPLKGRIRQGVCQWCFGPQVKTAGGKEKFYAAAAAMGIKGIDLAKPEDYPLIQKHGLVCSMVPTSGITPGLNRKEHHAPCLARARERIDIAAAFGFPNVLVMSGNRDGISDDEGLANCADGIRQIIGHAEEKKITLCMELLNSKRDHKDYQCDRTAWGVELCKKVGSPRMKLLYDIYHMQVQEGDVVATIRENIEYIGHFHTAGVPGRNEIDDSQELYYPAIMRAIADLHDAGRFDGFVSHEFTARRDAMTAIASAVKICNV